VLGAVSPAEQARLEERLLQELRSRLGREAVATLTAGHDALLSWFFAGFANRYLMASLPGQLAAQLAKFAHFRETRVIVDVVPGPQGAADGLLIYIRGLSRPHTRVAYALSRSRLDIGSGKVNRVELSGAEHAYCYYFQVSRLDFEVPLAARDLELMIAGESPPELSFPTRTQRYERTGVRVEFQGDDRKGYHVVPRGGRFEREDVSYHHLRVVLRDEPYLFYKVTRAFDLFDAEVQQALITTIGNQVVDYFYLRPEDYERLRNSRFEEVLIDLVHSDLLAVAR
jgi:UTP:GlnB (protein PII) uridylyltransferase